jgi:hypothetical protein
MPPLEIFSFPCMTAAERRDFISNPKNRMKISLNQNRGESQWSLFSSTNPMWVKDRLCAHAWCRTLPSINSNTGHLLDHFSHRLSCFQACSLPRCSAASWASPTGWWAPPGCKGSILPLASTKDRLDSAIAGHLGAEEGDTAANPSCRVSEPENPAVRIPPAPSSFFCCYASEPTHRNAASAQLRQSVAKAPLWPTLFRRSVLDEYTVSAGSNRDYRSVCRRSRLEIE